MQIRMAIQDLLIYTLWYERGALHAGTIYKVLTP